MVDFLHTTEETKKTKPVSDNIEIGKKSENSNSWWRKLLKPITKSSRSINSPLVEVDFLQQSNNTDNTIVGKSKLKSGLVSKDSKAKDSTTSPQNKGFDVNLLPTGSSYSTSDKLVTYIIVYLGVSLIIILIGWFGLKLYGNNLNQEETLLNNEIAQLDGQINKYQQSLTKATDWQLKLAAVDGLLRGHIYWTNFFSALEKVTIPEVYYKGFSASILSPNINLISYTDNYRSAAKQLLIYNKYPDIFNEHSVASAKSEDYGGISYNVQAVLNPLMFFDQSFIKQEK